MSEADTAMRSRDGRSRDERSRNGRSWDDRNIWRAGLTARTLWLLGFVALFAFVSMLSDRYFYDNWHNPGVYEREWGRLMRVMGWWPTWVTAAFALWLAQRKADAPAAKRNAWYLTLAPGAAGLLSELLKLLIRRERPELNAGDYGFRAWSDEPFSTVGLGMPSGHTMVAFAAATALARIFPDARWVWYTLAAGCAATRVLSHAHFFSDVAVGVLFGWSVGWGVWIAMRRRASA